MELDIEVRDFVAVDFETYTAERTSACAIGLVKVVNGVITQKLYSLINPIPDNQDVNNVCIHGLTADMLENAPKFNELFPAMRDFIGDLPLVCHNRGMDINVFYRCMEHYDLSGIDIDNNYCTYELTKLSLKNCCDKYNISIGKHHDALDDAIACAKVFLALQDIGVECVKTGDSNPFFIGLNDKRYESATLEMLDESVIEEKDTVFYRAKVVVTGTFEEYPNRNNLGKLLQSLGADVNTAISKRTNIVLMGEGAGPCKMKKIEGLRAEGYDIRIIREPELVELLKGRQI